MQRKNSYQVERRNRVFSSYSHSSGPLGKDLCQWEHSQLLPSGPIGLGSAHVSLGRRYSRAQLGPCLHIHGATDCRGEGTEVQKSVQGRDTEPSPCVAKQRQDQRGMEDSMAEQMQSPLPNSSHRRTYEGDSRS